MPRKGYKQTEEHKIKISKAKGSEIEVICKWCNKKFCVKPSRIKKGGGKYCSKKCYDEWQKIDPNKKGKNNPSYKGQNHSFVTSRKPNKTGIVIKERYIWSNLRKCFTKEHTVKAENVLKRKMKKGEVVHHIDCNPLNNNNNNLIIMYRNDHSYLHGEMSRRFAQEHFG